MTDKALPTVPIRLTKKVTGLASQTLLGSCTIPKDYIGQLTVREVMSSSANIWFVICGVSGSPRYGSMHHMYLEAAGVDREITSLDNPIESFEPGSVRVYAINPSATASVGMNMRIDLV